MSMYNQFQTDTSLESKGVIVDYGDFRVTIGRAGGSNKRYARILAAKSKKHRRAIQTETITDEKALNLLREVFAESVVFNWETKVDGKWKKGIEGKDGKLLQFTVDNIIATFVALPDLFADIQEQAGSITLFRVVINEEDAGN